MKKLLCTETPACTIFTSGKIYEQNKKGYILDDLKRERFICSSMQFLVGHNGTFPCEKPLFAYFEEID